MDADGFRGWLASDDVGHPPLAEARPWWPWHRPQPLELPAGTTTVVEVSVDVLDRSGRLLSVFLDADGRRLGHAARQRALEPRPPVGSVAYRRCPAYVRARVVEEVWPGVTRGATFHPWRTAILASLSFVVVLAAVLLIVDASR